MEAIPAIDLRDGKAVRLYQGDYEQETVFDEDPVRVASRWESEGAGRIHVVDLDGARAGSPTHTDIVKRILDAISIPIQVGGGVRTLADIERLLDLGVEKVVLGTVAVENPDLVAEACAKFDSARIIVGIDARDGFVAVRGWRESSKWTSVEVAIELVARGVTRFVHTDIARDGTLEGPNLPAMASFAKALDAAVIASGGVSNAADVRALTATGVEAAIIGRALYSDALTLRDAIEAAGA